jgi:hypothetical protein
MSNKTTINLGGSFLSYLTLIFITLKLTGVISWGWWLVLSPIILNVALILLFLAMALIIEIIKAK